jgi:putative endonuclease
MSKGGYVYIVASRSRRIYIGVTSDLVRRVDEHKRKVGSSFAAKYNMDRLVYYEQYGDIRDAIEREKQLKKWRREKKVGLIERENPEWRDLTEDWVA